MEWNEFMINKTLNIKLIYFNKNTISNMLNFANIYLLIYQILELHLKSEISRRNK